MVFERGSEYALTHKGVNRGVMMSLHKVIKVLPCF